MNKQKIIQIIQYFTYGVALILFFRKPILGILLYAFATIGIHIYNNGLNQSLNQLNKISDSVNISKLFPNYVKKWVFRSALILVLLLSALTYISNDYNFSFNYIECQTPHRCINFYYVCQENETDCINYYEIPSEQTEFYNNFGQNKYLESGEVVGIKPNTLAEYYNIFCFLIALLSIIINHFIYVGSRKHERI